MATTRESAEYRPFKSDEARARYLAHYDATEKAWPVVSEALTVSTAYGDTFMRVTGPADAPPLLLLPPGNSPSQAWYPMIGALSERFRTYALDAIYDVGRSVPSRPIKGVPDVMAWLDSLLDNLGMRDPVDLMGLSLGGSITAEYVLHAPERLRKAVWISPAAVTAPVSRGFITGALSCVLPLRGAYRKYVRWMMPDLSADERELDQMVDGLLLARQCYGMAPKVNPRQLTDAELSAIETPVMYVVGERDVVCEDLRRQSPTWCSGASGIETLWSLTPATKRMPCSRGLSPRGCWSSSRRERRCAIDSLYFTVKYSYGETPQATPLRMSRARMRTRHSPGLIRPGSRTLYVE